MAFSLLSVLGIAFTSTRSVALSACNTARSANNISLKDLISGR